MNFCAKMASIPNPRCSDYFCGINRSKLDEMTRLLSEDSLKAITVIKVLKMFYETRQKVCLSSTIKGTANWADLLEKLSKKNRLQY